MEREEMRARIRKRVGKPVIWLIISCMTVLKPFKFLHRFLPGKLRELVKCWDMKMLSSYFLSGGSRIFMDQNCILKTPPNFKPLVDVDPKYRFSEKEIESFYDNGFIGPITLWTPEEMAAMRPHIEEVLQRPSTVFPNAENKWRELHVDCPEFWNLITSAQIRERLAQLLDRTYLYGGLRCS